MAKTIEIDTEGYSVVFKLSPEGTTFRMGIVDAGRMARAVLKACASRQRIVELFPSTHRRASVTLNRRRIVEIGGGREASSCVEVTPGAAVAVPHRGLRRGELENGRSRNSRRKRTVGSPWWVYTDTYDQSARPRG